MALLLDAAEREVRREGHIEPPGKGSLNVLTDERGEVLPNESDSNPNGSPQPPATKAGSRNG